MPTGDPDVKCRVQLLGAPSIWTPTGQLSATKPLVFGAALYLGLNRGTAFPRTQLATLLWPDTDEVARGERSRWLIHQLRTIGLAGPARAPDIGLGRRQVALDVDELATAASASDVLALVRGDVLAGYDPRISDTFARWVDETRDVQRSTVIQALDGWLTTVRRTASWLEVEEIARRILALDELHERASIALAEALALNGRRDASLLVLARYQTAVGTDAGSAAARALHHRLAETPSTGDATSRRTAFSGRGDTLARLLDSIDTTRPSSRRIGLAGPAGIGKSRLLEELSTVAKLRGTQVARVRCAQGDALRPLSLATDLARALLEMRGALGASPSSIETLRAFLGEDAAVRDDIPNEARRAAVYAAMSDLIGALSDDGPVAVVVDDAQWAEPGSWTILAPLLLQHTPAPFSWIIALRAETQDIVTAAFRTIFPPGGAAADQDRETLWLSPLDPGDVAILCTARSAPRHIPPAVLDVLVQRAAGIPFVAEALVDHWMEGGDIAALPSSVSRLVSARLDRLSPNSVCVLEGVAVLGPDAELVGLEAVCLIERAAMLEVSRELESAGILRSEAGRFSAHALWTEAVLARAPRTTLQVLHRYAAQWLGHDTATNRSTDHRRHWAVARHWFEAGDPDRARNALDRAADVLSASGFSAHAAAMVERCAEIAGVSDATLHYWTRAAGLWLVAAQAHEAHLAIARIHAQYDRVGRALDVSFSPHHEVEAMAHTSFIRMYLSQGEWDGGVRQWMLCATEATASHTHRTLATTHIIDMFARGLTDRGTVDAAWSAIETLTPATLRERFEAHFCAGLYFARVANQPAVAVEHLEQARAMISEHPAFGAVDFRRVSFVLADCHEFVGDLDRARATHWQLYEQGKLLRNQSMVTYALGGLIATALETGRHADARPLLPLFGRPSTEYKTEWDIGRMISWVVCELEEGDARQARADMTVPLEEAEHAPGDMPRARLLAIYAHLALLENDNVTAERLLPGLLECFSYRMSYMHHPAYVAGLCLQRYRGTGAAAKFVKRFLDEISLERWTPREELLAMARGEETGVILHGLRERRPA